MNTQQILYKFGQLRKLDCNCLPHTNRITFKVLRNAKNYDYEKNIRKFSREKKETRSYLKFLENIISLYHFLKYVLRYTCGREFVMYFSLDTPSMYSLEDMQFINSRNFCSRFCLLCKITCTFYEIVLLI